MSGAPSTSLDVGTGYGNTSRITDVTDYIYQIKPEDKPFFHMCGEDTAKDPVHQWQKRTFTTYNHNAQNRGFKYTFPTANIYPTREFNFTQILGKEIRVSDTEKNSSHFAIDRLFSDQMQLALSIIGTDAEVALLLGTMASGDATNLAPQMRGLLWALQTSGTTYTNMGGGIGLTEDLFNTFVQTLWEFGSEPRDVLVGGRLKRMISGFTASSTRYIAADASRLVRTVSDYESDFFPTMIHLSRVVHSGAVSVLTNETGGIASGCALVFVDTTMLKKAWLQPLLAEVTARVAHSTDGVLSMELTLDYGHPHAHMWVANITA